MEELQNVTTITVKVNPQLSDLKGPGTSKLTSKLNNFENFDRKKANSPTCLTQWAPDMKWKRIKKELEKSWKRIEKKMSK